MLSAFREAVARWNAKYLTDGWRSGPDLLHCPKCQADRVVYLSTIYGRTTAGCVVCHHTWVIDV
jgi:hypothetical protein